MTEHFEEGPAAKLRASVLNAALSTVALSSRTARADTLRWAEILPEGGDFPSFRIHTFEEGSQDDGAIVQVSFETYGISGANLILKSNKMSYEESSINGGFVEIDEVNDSQAEELLRKLSPIIKNRP